MACFKSWLHFGVSGQQIVKCEWSLNLQFKLSVNKCVCLPVSVRVCMRMCVRVSFMSACHPNIWSIHVCTYQRERSGSVVECLTRKRGAVGSSLTGVTAFCP